MSASIFGDRFIGKREQAWHNLGKVFTQAMTATEAIKEADITFAVNKEQLFLADGMAVPGKFALTRPAVKGAAKAIFGIVGKEYQSIQATQLAKFLDPLTEKMPVETAGALGEGETIFLCLDGGKHSIKGEEILQYFLVTDYRGGGETLKILYTPVRVVCQNTLIMGLADATVRVDLHHDKNIERDAQFYITLMEQLGKRRQQGMQLMEQLAETKLTDSQAKAVIEAAFPKPKVGNRLARIQGFQASDFKGNQAMWKTLDADRTTRETHRIIRECCL